LAGYFGVMNNSFVFTATAEQQDGITVKSARELDAMRRAGRVVAWTIEALMGAVRPGITTEALDVISRTEMARHGAKPSFLGYRGFPATICTSINEEIVHGIPGDKVLRDGDIVKLDCGAIVDGIHADSAVTVGVGKIAEEQEELLRVTRLSLEAGIKASRGGARVGDIGIAIEGYVATQGQYGVVREYVGHGIGRRLHEEPQIPNYAGSSRGALLRPGMAIAIEPMVNLGTWRTRMLDDGWTVLTADGKLSAHFEHTMIITDGEAEVVTRRKDEGSF